MEERGPKNIFLHWIQSINNLSQVISQWKKIAKGLLSIWQETFLSFFPYPHATYLKFQSWGTFVSKANENPVQIAQLMHKGSSVRITWVALWTVVFFFAVPSHRQFDLQEISASNKVPRILNPLYKQKIVVQHTEFTFDAWTQPKQIVREDINTNSLKNVASSGHLFINIVSKFWKNLQRCLLDEVQQQPGILKWLSITVHRVLSPYSWALPYWF